jgi:hypothetical protein
LWICDHIKKGFPKHPDQLNDRVHIAEKFEFLRYKEGKRGVMGASGEKILMNGHMGQNDASHKAIREPHDNTRRLFVLNKV